jgi:DNA invertase Pin-like site-specific DNA recombinase
MKKKTAYRSPGQLTCCAIYARTATVKKPKEGNSITKQVAKCKRLAKGQGWIVREDCIFTDSGKSGLKVNSGLKDLLHNAAVEPKSFDVLLCVSTDRIARSTGLAIRIHRAIKKYAVEIRFTDRRL